MNASGRPNTCKSREKPFGAETGARVRNAHTICLSHRDSPKKFGLIPNGIWEWHHIYIKAEAVKDEYAFY